MLKYYILLSVQRLTIILDKCVESGIDPNLPYVGHPLPTSFPTEFCHKSVDFSLDNGPLGWGSPVKLGQLNDNGGIRGTSVKTTPFRGCISHYSVKHKVVIQYPLSTLKL